MSVDLFRRGEGDAPVVDPVAARPPMALVEVAGTDEALRITWSARLFRGAGTRLTRAIAIAAASRAVR